MARSPLPFSCTWRSRSFLSCALEGLGLVDAAENQRSQIQAQVVDMNQAIAKLESQRAKIEAAGGVAQDLLAQAGDTAVAAAEEE